MNAVTPILFLAAASLGVWMAVRHFTGRPVPKAWGMLHGAIAITGIVFLAVIVWSFQPRQWGLIALVLFLLAAPGGAYMAWRQHRGKPWPNALVLAHGGTALTALVILLVWIVGTPDRSGTLTPTPETDVEDTTPLERFNGPADQPR